MKESPNRAASDSLPIHALIGGIREALMERDELLLQAPPGAGKTTQVPLSLLHEPWLDNKKILMLEPRRLAARGAAERMANTLGEELGQTVGYRVRLESKMSAATRIEVITEGILTRYLQDDPSLEDYALVIFDEFHERSLDADLGLALTLQGRAMFRDDSPLKLLIMSATLDGEEVATLISSADSPAPIITSEGRQFPVDVFYGPALSANERMAPVVSSKIMDVMEEKSGSLLVFLPGQGEIRQVEKALLQSTRFAHNFSEHSLVTPLYGDLSLSQQRAAVAPAELGLRKIVLATSIAESSLTIEGVSVVIDSGFSRVPAFDAGTGMTRLNTRRVSRASSHQRMGRAGRTQAGTCYRLWSEGLQLQPFSDPEILQADLAPLALSLYQWGEDDVGALSWLNPPPLAFFEQAKDLLRALGALDDKGHLSEHGTRMAALPCHPRLAHLLLQGQALSLTDLAADLASLLGERDLLRGNASQTLSADMSLRVSTLRIAGKGKQSGSVHRLKQHSRQLKGALPKTRGAAPKQEVDDDLALLLAFAYPDRIARRTSERGLDYKLSNGRKARLNLDDPLQKHEWLVAANLGGREGESSDRIFLAAALNPRFFQSELATLLSTRVVVAWDLQQDRLVAEELIELGAVIVSKKRLSSVPKEEKLVVLLDLLRTRGLSLLPWNDSINNWRARVNLMHRLGAQQANEAWPCIDDVHLMENLEHWLAPFLEGVTHINHFSKLNLAEILNGLLTWEQSRELDRQLPLRFTVPSGSNIAIDYTQSTPVLAVRLQEMLGCVDNPAVARGRVPLLLHLLTPAQRPLAVTQDLQSFWVNAYPQVKKEYKGRYPKHHWPDDPLKAQPSARIKPRSQK